VEKDKVHFNLELVVESSDGKSFSAKEPIGDSISKTRIDIALERLLATLDKRRAKYIGIRT